MKSSDKKTTKKKVDENKITTIKLLGETKLRIEKLREHKRESYDDILRKILYVLNIARDDPEKARKILEKISNLRERMLEEERQQKEALEAEKKLK
jgi:DNA-directed RNA polymerase subunit F